MLKFRNPSDTMESFSQTNVSPLSYYARVVVITTFFALQLLSTPALANNCHLRELDLCLAPVAVFTQNINSRPVSNYEISRQCKILSETDNCLSNFTTRCMTPNQANTLKFFSDGGLNTIKDLCRPNSRLHQTYLRHGDCINKQEKTQKICMRDFQASLEKAVEIEWQDRLKLACCSFNRLNACVRDVIEPRCGSEAYEFSRTIFRTSFSRLPTVACSKYNPNGRACLALFPPAGTMPKGSKSRSVLSKLFSAYTAE